MIYSPDADLTQGIAVHKQYNNKWTLAIDAGANLGYHSKLYCTMFSNVIGFEPNRGLELTQLDLKNLHTNYQYYMLGLYDRNTEVEYYDVLTGPGLSSIKFEYISQHLDLSINDVKKYKIQTKTLDSFDLAVDFIKIDVEGVGLEVLMGAEQTIMQHLPTIQIEIGNEAVWLKKHGYVKIEQDTLLTSVLSDNFYVHESRL
jgi:FkbM family methyltransferase